MSAVTGGKVGQAGSQGAIWTGVGLVPRERAPVDLLDGSRRVAPIVVTARVCAAAC